MRFSTWRRKRPGVNKLPQVQLTVLERGEAGDRFQDEVSCCWEAVSDRAWRGVTFIVVVPQHGQAWMFQFLQMAKCFSCMGSANMPKERDR